MIGIYGEHMGFDPEPLVMHYAAFLPRPRLRQGQAHPADPAPLSSAKILRFGKLPPFPRFSIKAFPAVPAASSAPASRAVLLFAAASWVLQPVPVTPSDEQMVQSVAPDPQNDPMPTASTGEKRRPMSQVREEPMPEDEAAEPKSTDETPPTGKEPASEEDALVRHWRVHRRRLSSRPARDTAAAAGRCLRPTEPADQEAAAVSSAQSRRIAPGAQGQGAGRGCASRMRRAMW